MDTFDMNNFDLTAYNFYIFDHFPQFVQNLLSKRTIGLLTCESSCRNLYEPIFFEDIIIQQQEV